MENKWFSSPGCTSVTIKKYKSVSDHTIVAQVNVQDAAVAQKMAETIESIPTQGNRERKFAAENEQMDLEFTCNGKPETIHFFDQRIKTPSTLFHSTKIDAETKIFTDVVTLLNPEISRPILKVKGLEISYPEFSLMYTGAREGTSPENSTATLNRESFRIKDKEGNEQVLEITSGQLPPAPKEFKIGDQTYSLISYETKNRFRLYPDYIQIVKK